MNHIPDRVNPKKTTSHKFSFALALLSITIIALCQIALAGDDKGMKMMDHGEGMMRHDMPSEQKAIEPGSGGDFSLTDHFGKKVALHDYKGKTVILFFGFANCPHICPPALSNIDSAIRTLGGLAKKIQVLMVTVDPERDTPAKLREFVTVFNPEFLGLTGTMREIQKVTEQYSITFSKGDKDENGDYQVRHTSVINIVDSQGELVDVIPYNTPVDDMSRIIKEHAEGK